MWVVRTERFTVFKTAGTRSGDVAKGLLVGHADRVVVSERFSAYGRIDPTNQREESRLVQGFLYP